MKKSPLHMAFTLIEMLTAMAVLILMIGLMAQMVGLMGTTWSAGKAKVDNHTRARAMMDMISRDISACVLRPGDLAAFRDSSGTPAFIFYTKRSGFQAGPSDNVRPLSLVQYVYDSSATRLVRLDLPRAWSDAVSFGDNSQIPSAATLAGQTPREISPGVVAFSLNFLNSDGTLSITYGSNTTAVVVTLAAVDSRTLDLLKSASLLDGLKSSSVWAVDLTNGEPPLSQWQKRIDAGQLTLPKTAAGNLQIFQRVIRLPASLPHS